MMIEFIVSAVAAVGLSHLIVDGNIFNKWRGDLFKKYKKDPQHWVLQLITCYQCTGFWSGVLMGLLLQPVGWYGVFHSFLWWWLALLISLPFYLLITPFITACATSYLSMAGAGFLNWLDAPAMAIAAKKKDEQKDDASNKA